MTMNIFDGDHVVNVENDVLITLLCAHCLVVRAWAGGIVEARLAGRGTRVRRIDRLDEKLEIKDRA